MRIELRRRVLCQPSDLWPRIGDPVWIGSACDRLNIEPLDDQPPAVGARYRVQLDVGTVPVGGNIEIITHDEDRDLLWTTLTGVDHRMRIRLRPDGGATRVTVRFAYDAPGPLGIVADLASYASVRKVILQIADAIS